MAIRVESQDDIVFGVLVAAVDVTHIRFLKGGANPVVRPLAATLNVGAGERLIIPTGMFDVVYPANQLTNEHLQDVLDLFWDGEDIQVDAMTDDSTVVVDAGYAQQVYSNWSLTAEAD